MLLIYTFIHLVSVRKNLSRYDTTLPLWYQSLSALIFQSAKLFNTIFLRQQSKSYANKLNPDEKTRKYFWYEVTGSKSIDENFGIDVSGKTVLDARCGNGGYIYHLLKSGAAFVYGIDNDAARLEITTEILKESYDGNNYELSSCGIENIHHIAPSSTDIIICNNLAAFSGNRDKMFNQMRRVLRDSGHVYISISASWLSWDGAGLFKHIPLPWSHHLIPEPVIKSVLQRQAEKQGSSNAERLLANFNSAGKITMSAVKREIRRNGFEITAISKSGINPLNKLPVLEEFFSSGIQIHIRKKIIR
jgi:ubiquinone/menaquinone biosynthesis C-methylase UbiE